MSRFEEASRLLRGAYAADCLAASGRTGNPQMCMEMRDALATEAHRLIGPIKQSFIPVNTGRWVDRIKPWLALNPKGPVTVHGVIRAALEGDPNKATLEEMDYVADILRALDWVETVQPGPLAPKWYPTTGVPSNTVEQVEDIHKNGTGRCPYCDVELRDLVEMWRRANRPTPFESTANAILNKADVLATILTARCIAAAGGK